MSASPHAVVLVTGLSGAGKSSILRILEDIGFEAVDNPPLPLVEQLATGAARDGGRPLAIGVDARTRGFDAEKVLATLSRLRCHSGLKPELLFAWADGDVIRRRFTETRRRHPLSGSGSVSDGIATEQALAEPLRQHADLLLDTSGCPLAELRRIVEQRYGGGQAAERGRMAISVLSFAFPAGLPRGADMVFDVRFLANPHYVAELRELTGLDPAVRNFIAADPDYASLLAQLLGLCRFVLPRFVREGKKYVTIAVGCTGGRHRSVLMSQALGETLGEEGWNVSVRHRELAISGLVIATSEGDQR